MPRPHIPHHLSLQRIKNANTNNHSSANAGTTPAPSTPPTHSRGSSPSRKDHAGLSPSESRGAGAHNGLVLRVHVHRGRGLAPKDKNGVSDPFLVLHLGDRREATSVVNKTLDPEWGQIFEFPVADKEAGLLEVICWDKDRFRKQYMGEFDVMLEDIFLSQERQQSLQPEAQWFSLASRRGGRKRKKDVTVTGEVLLQFSLHDPLNPAASTSQIINKFSGVVSTGEDEEDELELMSSRGLIDVSEESHDDDDDDIEKGRSEETDDGTKTPLESLDTDEKQKRRREKKIAKMKRKKKLAAYEFNTGVGSDSSVAGVLFLEINRITDLPPERNSTKTGFDMDPFVVTSLGKKTYRTRVVNHNLNPIYDEKLVFQVQKHEINYSLHFAVVDRDKFSGNDFVGTTTFPLPQLRDMAPDADPLTGLYKLPDPEAHTEAEIETQKKKKWRPTLSRSTSSTAISRNSSSGDLHRLTRTTSSNSLRSEQTANQPTRPGLRRLESESDVLDRLSAHNSHAQRPAPTSVPSYTSVMSTGESGPGAGHNGTVNEHDPDLLAFELPLELKKSKWQDKHHPMLYIHAKFLPYRALRQQFWRAMLRQYDADESGKIDKVELMTMLDTLGSTLHNSTIDGFFARWHDENIQNGIILHGNEKSGDHKDHKILTMDQAVICLEEQLMKTKDTYKHLHRPHWHRAESTKSHVNALGLESSPDVSPGGTTPYLAGVDSAAAARQHQVGSGSTLLNPTPSAIPALEISDMSEGGEGTDTKSTPATPSLERTSSLGRIDSWESEADLNDDPESKEEHVVEIQECPICHMPRLSRRGKKRVATDADIITHIATCASSDWRAVNNLVMAGFVTSSQAQRKWYSKVVTKISYGGYKLGANSANILVQDRMTGMINEERMSVYVRLGIRLLYKGLKSREMEKKRIRKLLRGLSFKQGRKYDDPASASQIPGFINFHQLDMSEVLLKTEEFKTFNEFFYRKLKPDARPCSAPTDPHIIVSPADCRSVVFNRMEDAQRIWVKGREFSIERLFGDAYPLDAKRYKNGALGIFRLAPQDYHRFHIPVDGIMGEPKLIQGEYYTVNPMAIRSALDVYGENIRVVVPIDSAVHGRVMVVCVGAMMVGSTVITRKPGDNVKRAEELGYFKFGGSTLLVLFEPGVMRFDDDLVTNSNGALETLIRVGMSIGHSPGYEQWKPDMPKLNPTAAEKQDAKRRIEGALGSDSTHGVDPVPMGAPL